MTVAEPSPRRKPASGRREPAGAAPGKAEYETRIAALEAELRESRAYQTATSDVLKAVSHSTFDLQSVLDTLVETAAQLCHAEMGMIAKHDGDVYRAAATFAFSAEWNALVWEVAFEPGRGSVIGRTARTRETVHVTDLAADPEYTMAKVITVGGMRTALGVPLLRQGEAIGVLYLARQRVEPFTDRQIELVRTFADQAVIAIENARLFKETRERTRDLQETLEYQTATSDVLQVISRSAFDLRPVLDTLIETAARLCGAEKAILYRYENGAYRFAAGYSTEPEYERIERVTPIYPGEGTVAGRAALRQRAVQIIDALADPLYEQKEAARVGKARSMIGVPMLRDGSPIGVIALARERVEPFTGRQIELVQTFADQAVIAIENARLMTETREALEQQTATAEVLQIINASPGNLAPVFDAMLEKAVRLLNADFGIMWRFEDGLMRLGATHNVPSAFVEHHRKPMRPGPDSGPGRMMRGESGFITGDFLQFPPYLAGDPAVRSIVELAGARSAVIAPLRKDDTALGSITIYRQDEQPFTEKQLAVLQNFAAQAVIAMENARLITETREARDDAESALRDLKVAQASLIQAEKMASLGQLTAGIAHEIKNPLNFVNNFAGLSVELLDELKTVAAPLLENDGGGVRAEIDETIAMLSSNMEKIVEHGRRADGIVRSMLEHSRGASGERRAVDLNELIDEALNLAYHGARAQDQSFNITLERDFDPAAAPIEVAPQEMTRVFLNLFGNGFYAANKRARELGPARAGVGRDASFRPVLTVATRDLGEAVEIRVRDNGTGIQPEHRDKLFQPFFTTKPTGEGTGLGLSITYDIVTQQHSGTIEVDSEIDAFTEFTVRLPRSGAATMEGGA